MTVQSAITSKGQATIPKPVREHLKLKPGDKIKFFIDSHGRVTLLPTLPASALRGIVKSKRKKPVTLEEMDEAIAAGAVAKFRRATQK